MMTAYTDSIALCDKNSSPLVPADQTDCMEMLELGTSQKIQSLVAA